MEKQFQWETNSNNSTKNQKLGFVITHILSNLWNLGCKAVTEYGSENEGKKNKISLVNSATTRMLSLIILLLSAFYIIATLI
jgi:hypothetical protein